jgi:hypothetical protein
VIFLTFSSMSILALGSCAGDPAGSVLAGGTLSAAGADSAFTAAAAGAFGTITSTVTKDVGNGTNRQIQMSLRLNF